ncbi:Uncharacterised protein [Chlamydia abortus]|nr:Uncharacterised protein [Chlamydia abortus]
MNGKMQADVLYVVSGHETIPEAGAGPRSGL